VILLGTNLQFAFAHFINSDEKYSPNVNVSYCSMF